jgi:putative salt-induced outer membrane protein YdiY
MQIRQALTAFTLAGLASASFAQVNVVKDGQWRSAIGLGLTNSTGNTKSTSLSLNADAVRASSYDKWAFYGKGLYAKDDEGTTSDLIRLGTRYDRDIGERFFGFGGLDAERDGVADLSLRAMASTGVGYKIIDSGPDTFNVFGGIGYTYDRYSVARDVDGGLRDTYGYANLVFGEESTHAFTDTVSARQRFALLPNLRNTGEYRAEFDSSLSVAMTQRLSLNVGFTARYNSDPGIDEAKTDTLLTTGIAMKFE